jgi:hypothetical protein
MEGEEINSIAINLSLINYMNTLKPNTATCPTLQCRSTRKNLMYINKRASVIECGYRIRK